MRRTHLQALEERPYRPCSRWQESVLARRDGCLVLIFLARLVHYGGVRALLPDKIGVAGAGCAGNGT